LGLRGRPVPRSQPATSAAGAPVRSSVAASQHRLSAPAWCLCVPHLHLRRPHGHVREGAQIGKRAPRRSRRCSGLQRTTANGDGRPEAPTGDGTETRTETRAKRCPPPNGSGNGHRRRSERWRWDLNPRESYPSTRFRVLRTHVHARLSASASCSPRPAATLPEPSRTATNETRTETRWRGGWCPSRAAGTRCHRPPADDDE
jgi:hypothetical protein